MNKLLSDSDKKILGFASLMVAEKKLREQKDLNTKPSRENEEHERRISALEEGSESYQYSSDDYDRNSFWARRGFVQNFIDVVGEPAVRCISAFSVSWFAYFVLTQFGWFPLVEEYATDFIAPLLKTFASTFIDLVNLLFSGAES